MELEFNRERLQSDRRARLRREMKALGVGALYLSDEADFRYVVDVKVPGGSVFVSHEGQPILYSRSRDRGYVERQYENVRLAVRGNHDAGSGQEEKLARWAQEMRATMKEFGVEKGKLGVGVLDIQAFRALINEGIDVVDGRYALTMAKRVKTQDELTCFRIIGKWYQDVMERFQEAIKPGLKEIELAAVVHHAAIRNGVEEIFQLNVCAGENMNPWRRWPTDRKVKAEELVGVDLHVVGPGACWADVSRTYYCGENPTQAQKDLYRLTLDYLQKVIALLKPGEHIDEVVKRMPPVPEKYQEQLKNYSIAHADAMKPHEYPRIEWKKTSTDSLEVGMVFSVETYFREVGAKDAVKIEELVAITEKGAEVLSTAPYEQRLL